MRCDDTTAECDECGEIWFQSLLGFLMRCDRPYGERNYVTENMFQSLLGFLMRCDNPEMLAFIRLHKVSISVGFSDALRPPLYKGGGLKMEMFQSLLGFLMRCDFN